MTPVLPGAVRLATATNGLSLDDPRFAFETLFWAPDHGLVLWSLGGPDSHAPEGRIERLTPPDVVAWCATVGRPLSAVLATLDALQR